MAKIGMVSLGCAKNLVNSEQMLYLLREADFEIVAEAENADAVIVNTCGFIESAKAEAIDSVLELAEMKKSGELGKIIVAGCMAQRYKNEILDEIPEVDAVFGTGSYSDVVEIVNLTLDGMRVSVFGDIDTGDLETKRIVSTPPAWAYLKIAEGCDNRCAYCAIPDIRGKFRSRPLDKVIDEARQLAENGVRELIIVAQDITRYGLDLYGKRTLAELLTELCKIDGLKWIRLHYLYPDEIDAQLISVIASNDKIIKYLDIPLQHINDSILKKMRRRGTGAEIRALLKNIRENIPGVVLRTSLITGLPGEDDAEFEELCDFLREAKIERVGVFAFSPEEGTDAANMERVDTDTAQKRAELIMQLQSGIMDDFNESRIGQVITVLCEEFDGQYYHGRSFSESPDIDGYILFSGAEISIGQFVDVRITGVIDGEPVGEKRL